MTRQQRAWTLATAGGAVLAGAGFAAAQLWGEGAGMPLVAAGGAVWTGWFVRKSTSGGRL